MSTETDIFFSFHVFVIKKMFLNLPFRPLHTASFYKSKALLELSCFPFREMLPCLREEATGQFEAWKSPRPSGNPGGLGS